MLNIFCVDKEVHFTQERGSQFLPDFQRLIILARVKNHWAKAPFISNSRTAKELLLGDKRVKGCVCVCVCGVCVVCVCVCVWCVCVCVVCLCVWCVCVCVCVYKGR